MITIYTYWEEKQFDMIKHWQTIKHFVNFEVPDTFTDEDIADLCKRKDVILIKS